MRPRDHAGLRLARQATENHGYMVTSVLVAAARDHQAIAVNFLAAGGRLQADGHLRPRRERSRAAELHPVLVEDDRVGSQREPGVPCVYGNVVMMVV